MSSGFERPDPETILRSIKKEEALMKKGKLKVFFGMSAGSGKTFAMLSAAQRLKSEGIDVVAGYLETHNRAETEELAKDLEILPRKKIDYNGFLIEEFDIDALLARKPSVALVDELAHTNAPGSRHPKRYQDVLELLDHDIDVYTTLNVQHIESQVDVVEQITGIKIRETLPDSIMDHADSIELVDISPEGLLKRLKEGKVYIPEKARLASESFFREGNITALREMALRYAAKLVDDDLRDYMRKKNIHGPWKAGDRLLVAVSPSPYSEYLIRWTRRMAFNLRSSWVAIYIENQGRLNDESRKLLAKNLNLAQELGAEVISTVDDNIVAGLVRTARKMNITQIVVGKPLRRYFTDIISGGNLVERLLKASGNIEIHVVTQPDVEKRKFNLFGLFNFSSKINEYVAVFVSVSGVTLLNLIISRYTGYWAIALIYLLYVLLFSYFVGRGPVFLSATLSALAWNFLFIPPVFTFRINRLDDAMMFGTYFITALLTGGLTSKLRAKELALRNREKRISELYEFSRAIGNAVDTDDVALISIEYLEKYFDSKAALVLADEYGKVSSSAHNYGSFAISEKGEGVVEWVYKNNKPAGLFTDTLPQSDAHYLPLTAMGNILGVLCIKPESEVAFSQEQESFLQNISYQISIRLEREKLSEAGRNAKLAVESERIYKILLNSISHELRTPLTTISGAASSLLDETVTLVPETRKALVYEIDKSSRRLNRLVENLLDMTRFESGMMKLKRHLYDIGDLVSVSLRDLGNELSDHTISIDVADSLPMINIDFTLMEQVLSNLIFNAIVHTQAGTIIMIKSFVNDKGVNIIVEDNGSGIDESRLPVMFEKFQNSADTASGRTGLGLSICRGIVEAHGGEISVENIITGGARFIIVFPIESVTDSDRVRTND